MGNLIVIAVLSLLVVAIVRKLWKSHRNTACSSACTACPVVKTCSKDALSIKNELRQELRNH